MRQLIGVIYLLVLASVLTVVSCKEALECPVDVGDWYENSQSFKWGCELDSDCVVPRGSPSCVCGETYPKSRIEEVEEIYSCIDCGGGLSPACLIVTTACIEGYCRDMNPQPL